jgi:hypothetical protein
MSGWLAIGLVVIGLVAVAVTVLLFDLARGDVGGRHTMSRARRLLVVATDERTRARAEEWIDHQHHERPDLQCFLLVEDEGEPLYGAIHDALDREHPDGIVIVKHEAEPSGDRDTLAGLKQEGTGPTIWRSSRRSAASVASTVRPPSPRSG